MLSVLDLKLIKLSSNKLQKTIDKYNSLKNEIIDSIGEKKFFDIIKSNEYKNMIETNDKVFGLIDLSKNDTGLAKITDDANYERYLCKISLQEKFFNNELTEVKNRD